MIALRIKMQLFLANLAPVLFQLLMREPAVTRSPSLRKSILLSAGIIADKIQTMFTDMEIQRSVAVSQLHRIAQVNSMSDSIYQKQVKSILRNSVAVQFKSQLDNYASNKCCSEGINSSPPSAAYIRQWIRSALVQIMTCRLFGAKPLSKPLLGYCQLDPLEQTSVKF